MAITIIKTAAQRFLASLKLTAMRLFDKGVDSVLSDFNRFATRLDTYIDRQAAVVDQATRQATESFARHKAVREAEELFRKQVYTREDNALANMGRAQRVRAKLRDLLD